MKVMYWGDLVNYEGEEEAESNTCEGEKAGKDWV